MILLEHGLEDAIRKAIRLNLQAKAREIPAFGGVRIIGFWLDTEDGTDVGQDAQGLHVMLMAHPNTSEGYNKSYALEPQRTIQIDVVCVSQPDSDISREICRELYRAVRAVFETVPNPLEMPEGVEFGGCLLTNGGSADIDNLGQVTSFQVEMKVSLINITEV